MARLDQRHPDNVDGDWFCDTRCIECDVARHFAPGLIGSVQGQSVVIRQPATSDEELVMWRAALACPTQSIGTQSRSKAPAGVFPHLLEGSGGVHLCGYNSADSFGAHAYLVVRPGGNLLVDAPRFVKPLYERIDELGGIAHVLLSHRDDVADADRWAERYGARVWIHVLERDAAPFATDVLFSGADPDRAVPVTIEPGVSAHWVPGHTRGSVAFEVDGRCLFTGDTLHWNHQRGEPDVFPRQTWYSWDELVGSIARLAGLDIEWLLPGHGKWRRFEPGAYGTSMRVLAEGLASSSRSAWGSRPRAGLVD